MSKVNGHTRYFNKAGKQVVGVTTVVSQLAKNALAPAANKLGLAGVDSTRYWGELADIGSLAHDMILCHVKGIECDTSDYSPKQKGLAENCFLSYLEWEKRHKVEPILVEQPLVSEEYQYGGTPDCLAILDGIETLIDYKTGGVYTEAYLQTCAYVHLLYKAGHNPTRILILGIPRANDDSFIERTYTEFKNGWDAFECLLNLYTVMKRINKEH